MNLKELIRNIKEKITIQTLTEISNDDIKGFNDDKIEEFNELEIFFYEKCTEEEKLIIEQKLDLLYKYYMDYSLSCNNLRKIERIKEDFKVFSSLYLIMLKKDKEKTLNIDNALLFLSVNCMNSVPCKNYNEFIDKLTHPLFVSNIKPFSTELVASIISIKLRESILSREELFDRNNLDKEMFDFLITDVYSRISPPKTDNIDDQIKINLSISKRNIVENIKKASEYNRSFYNKYIDKEPALEVYYNMENNNAVKYLLYEEFLKNKYDHPFLETQLRLTALAIVQNIDISDYSIDELDKLVIKMDTVPYIEFSKKLKIDPDEEKLIK